MSMSELRRFAVQEPVAAAHEIARLRADNERLREALREWGELGQLLDAVLARRAAASPGEQESA